MRPSAEPPLPLAAAAAYGAAELALGLLLGGFLAWGRAEALLFLAFRPFLLIVSAGLVARWALRRRLLFYAAALAGAGLSQSLLLAGLGAASPWAEMARGWGAGALVLLVADPLVQLAQRRAGGRGRAAATLLLALLPLVPGASAPYERLALGATAPRAAAERPPLLLMSAIPLVWGEAGPFDPGGGPAPAYLALQREFEPRPVDWLDERALGQARLLLLAQPRALAAEELVALDAWVRRGGRALILVDPALEWPSRLPLGDPRRPPPIALLDPLLAHWGLRLEGPSEEELRLAGGRLLRVERPGRFAAAAEGGCAAHAGGLVARCRIGDGAAILVADADLLRADLWQGPGRRGGERHARAADNMLLVADWLDALAGIGRERVDRPVAWRDPEASPVRAIGFASLPLLLLLGFAAAARRRRG